MEKRKPYVKPAIASVNLIPDEAVLGNCKIGSSLGPTVTCEIEAVSCSLVGS